MSDFPMITSSSLISYFKLHLPVGRQGFQVEKSKIKNRSALCAMPFAILLEEHVGICSRCFDHLWHWFHSNGFDEVSHSQPFDQLTHSFPGSSIFIPPLPDFSNEIFDLGIRGFSLHKGNKD